MVTVVSRDIGHIVLLQRVVPDLRVELCESIHALHNLLLSVNEHQVLVISTETHVDSSLRLQEEAVYGYFTFSDGLEEDLEDGVFPFTVALDIQVWEFPACPLDPFGTNVARQERIDLEVGHLPVDLCQRCIENVQLYFLFTLRLDQHIHLDGSVEDVDSTHQYLLCVW